MNKITSIYQVRTALGTICHNDAQLSTLAKLDNLAASLEKPLKKSIFRKRPSSTKGLYIWGGVGTGKTYLMDLFVENVAVPSKRIHFHAFMQKVQNELHIARASGEKDALVVVAKNMVRDIRLLALDEMQIKDIADAMIVGRLFEQLHIRGVALITTSNRPPSDLYKNGLNRQLFLPFITFLEENLTIHDMKSNTDFRQNRIAGSKVYFNPLTATVKKEIDMLWCNLSDGIEEKHHIYIKGRELIIPRYHNGVGRLSFYELCSQPLGPADYLALAEALRVIVIDNIPQMDRQNFNEAKRFVTLIDALYETKTRLICSAVAEPEMLYLEGEGAFEFERTASRLREMQSADWST